ncbi:MAG: nicotinamide-nucleotide amidohydrolase family protein [Bifidobacteriaceae bacterium]|jgi:nicotinamide-nucleotide amidase|nr:nicotinamide-nucleotide amidohydrolase family protein [Bifidobacteriaceae bacterium]
MTDTTVDGTPAPSSDETSLAARLLAFCGERGFFIAGAESLTGGLLADAFVSVPGASAVFLGSAVTYHLGAKRHILGVDNSILNTEGAVDPRVAAQMAEGTSRVYSAAVSSDGLEMELTSNPVMGISTTGVAGPDSDGYKPVGLVYVGVRLPGAAEARVKELHVSGDRAGIRQATVVAAMQFALSLL